MQIKGSVVQARREFVTQHFGAEAWPRLLAALSADDRHVLGQQLLPSNWYDFALGERLDQAIVKVLGGGKTTVFEDIGAASARRNLAGAHRVFVTPGDPQAFLAKADAIYKLYYDIGRRTWEPSGPTAGVLTTHDAQTFSAADCLTVIGWYRVALELCGAKNVAITEDECRARGGKACRYRVRWTA